MFSRYAIYFLPEGPFAEFGSSWLGRDMVTGKNCTQPEKLGFDLKEITQKARRYGFHATIKPPFRLAEHRDSDALMAELAQICATARPIEAPGLELRRLGRFLALLPVGGQSEILSLAARVVRDLDGFRAPPEPAELDRRRRTDLSAAQGFNLKTWGYPHVMDQFRFHITLTDRMSTDRIRQVEPTLCDLLRPVLSVPFRIQTLSLVGEDRVGDFHEIRRLTMTG